MNFIRHPKLGRLTFAIVVCCLLLAVAAVVGGVTHSDVIGGHNLPVAGDVQWDHVP